MGNFCAQPSISAMSSKLKTQHVCRPHRGVYINTVNAARSPPTRLHPFALPAARYSAAETKRQSQAEAGLRLPGGGPAEEAAAWHGRAARRSRQRGGAQPSGAGAPSSTRQSVTCQLAGRHSRASQPGAGEQMASVTLRNQGVNWKRWGGGQRKSSEEQAAAWRTCVQTGAARTLGAEAWPAARPRAGQGPAAGESATEKEGGVLPLAGPRKPRLSRMKPPLRTESRTLSTHVCVTPRAPRAAAFLPKEKGRPRERRPLPGAPRRPRRPLPCPLASPTKLRMTRRGTRQGHRGAWHARPARAPRGG